MQQGRIASLTLLFGGLFFVAGVLGSSIATFEAASTLGLVRSTQKISDTAGGFDIALDDGDGFGIGVEEIGDVNDDGVVDLAVGAWMDDDGGTDVGAVYILFMNPNGTVASEQKISVGTGGFTGPLSTLGNFGIGIAGLGDFDGDGVEDIAVGERASNDGGNDRGAIWILFLNNDGTVKTQQKISDTSGGFAGVLANIDNFGTCAEPIADVNNDDIPDLVSCTPVDDDGGTDRGTLWVLYMNADGTVAGDHKITDLEGGFEGVLDNSDKFGSSFAVVGDLNDDGIDDWASGAPLDDDGATDAGAVWILFMNGDGTVASEQKISGITTNFTSLDSGDRFGADIEPMGDLDGDNVEDIAVGAWNDDDGGSNRGAVYIIFMNADGSVKRYQKVSDIAGNFPGVLRDEDSLGFQIAAVNDLNGDGIKELAAGAYGDDDGGSGRGAVWVMFLQQLNRNQSPSYVVPQQIALSINDGAACTPTREVTLALSARFAQDVVISNDKLFVDTSWEPFTEQSPMLRSWVLPEGDGEKTVYAVFRSEAQNLSNVVFDTIRLDEQGACQQRYLPE